MNLSCISAAKEDDFTFMILLIYNSQVGLKLKSCHKIHVLYPRHFLGYMCTLKLLHVTMMKDTCSAHTRNSTRTCTHSSVTIQLIALPQYNNYYSHTCSISHSWLPEILCTFNTCSALAIFFSLFFPFLLTCFDTIIWRNAVPSD